MMQLGLSEAASPAAAAAAACSDSSGGEAIEKSKAHTLGGFPPWNQQYLQFRRLLVFQNQQQEAQQVLLLCLWKIFLLTA